MLVFKNCLFSYIFKYGKHTLYHCKKKLHEGITFRRSRRVRSPKASLSKNRRFRVTTGGDIGYLFSDKNLRRGLGSDQRELPSKGAGHPVPVNKLTLPAALNAMEIDDSAPDRIPDIIEGLKGLKDITAYRKQPSPKMSTGIPSQDKGFVSFLPLGIFLKRFKRQWDR